MRPYELQKPLILSGADTGIGQKCDVAYKRCTHLSRWVLFFFVLDCINDNMQL